MAEKINVTSGNPVTFSFPFNTTVCIKGIKYANLIKDGQKIDEWPSTKRLWRVNVTHCTAKVSITNAIATDAGLYHVSLFPNISSGRYDESAEHELMVLSAVTGRGSSSAHCFSESKMFGRRDRFPLANFSLWMHKNVLRAE